MNDKYVIIGLGKTGLSCVHYLQKHNIPCCVVDSRSSLAHLNSFHQQYPQVSVYTGGFHLEVLLQAKEIIISPGVSINEIPLQLAIKSGVSVISDIEFFGRYIQSVPIVAITGSNGKSTVTSLVGAMVKAAGLRVAIGGNIGTPVFDLLDAGEVDLYVLELSSFQLEAIFFLKIQVAVFLNLSLDHMDRHQSKKEYGDAKQRIFKSCLSYVYNEDDAESKPKYINDDLIPSRSFTYKSPKNKQYGLIIDSDGCMWLSCGMKKICSVDNMKLSGSHNYSNALAALAVGELLHLNNDVMLKVLQEFEGLPHRCHMFCQHQGVSWVNDSKATNIGAAIASIEGLAMKHKGSIILIAGGEGKNADFSLLAPVVKLYVKNVIVLGHSAATLAFHLSADSKVSFVQTLHEAVSKAWQIAVQGDMVLLAPACSSFDMFHDFEHRGEQFMQIVSQLVRASI